MFGSACAHIERSSRSRSTSSTNTLRQPKMQSKLNIYTFIYTYIQVESSMYRVGVEPFLLLFYLWTLFYFFSFYLIKNWLSFYLLMYVLIETIDWLYRCIYVHILSLLLSLPSNKSLIWFTISWIAHFVSLSLDVLYIEILPTPPCV